MRAVWDVVASLPECPAGARRLRPAGSVQIAQAGIYDLRIHRDEVLVPVLRNWKIWDLEGLSGPAEAARDALDTFLADLDARAARFEDRRAAQRERAALRQG